MCNACILFIVACCLATEASAQPVPPAPQVYPGNVLRWEQLSVQPDRWRHWQSAPGAPAAELIEVIPFADAMPLPEPERYERAVTPAPPGHESQLDACLGAECSALSNSVVWPGETWTPTPSHTPTATPTETATDTPTATPIPTATVTDTPTGIPTDTPTEPPTLTPTLPPTLAPPVLLGDTATPTAAVTPTVGTGCALAPPLPSPFPAARWVRVIGPPTDQVVGLNLVDCTQTRSRTDPVGRSFSGIVACEGKLFAFGGGHDSHPANDVMLLSTANPCWAQQYPPECLPGCCANHCAADWSKGCGANPPAPTPHPCGVDAPCELASCSGGACVVIGGGGTTVVSPAGRPYVEHIYHRAACDPVRRVVVLGARSGFWEYDIALGGDRWTRLTDVAGLPFGTSIQNKATVYDPDLGQALWLSGDQAKVYRFDRTQPGSLGNGTMVVHDNYPRTGLTGSEIGTTYVAHRGEHAFTFSNAATGGLFLYHTATKVWTERTATAPAALRYAGTGGFTTSLAYVAPYLYALTNTGSAAVVLRWDPDMDIWTTLALTGTPPTWHANLQRWGVLWHDAASGLLWHVNYRNVGSGGQGGLGDNAVETSAIRLN